MGQADYYKHGDHNGICDLCGGKFKFSQLRKNSNGLYVCRKDYEPEHPQERVRGRADRQRVAVSRPEAADRFVGTNEVTVDDL